MKTYISWSGGKDSTASVILCHEHNIHLDGIIMSEVMYDHSRNISGENPQQIKWIYEVAIPKFESWGYNVTILRDKEDYLSLFNHIITTSKDENRNGKRQGFLFGGGCLANDRLKMRPLRKYFKQVGEHMQIVGIAVDEDERLERLHKQENKYSILEKYSYTEQMAFNLCERYDLLSPIYNYSFRGGCWFCPNAKIKERCEFRKNYPQLWQELIELGDLPNLAQKGFDYGKTIQEVTNEMDKYDKFINTQMKFDLDELK